LTPHDLNALCRIRSSIYASGSLIVYPERSTGRAELIEARGKTLEPPPLPPRIDYALRRIGGLRAVNQITERSRPFMYKDFCEAYSLAPSCGILGSATCRNVWLPRCCRDLSETGRWYTPCL